MEGCAAVQRTPHFIRQQVVDGLDRMKTRGTKAEFSFVLIPRSFGVNFRSVWILVLLGNQI